MFLEQRCQVEVHRRPEQERLFQDCWPPPAEQC